MSRKIREIKKNFKVFCEGDTEYHYVEGMKRELKLSIAIKLVNMKGGGYSSFLENLKIDGNTNCLAKFIIIDGDRAVSDHGEKKKLQELAEYCILQNNSGRIPHFLIVNYPNFEYVGCLHTPGYKGQDIGQYITKVMGYKDIGAFKADSKVYYVLNTGGNSSSRMLEALRSRHEDCFVRNEYKVDKAKYEMEVKLVCDWGKLGRKCSNMNEYFEAINAF